ncbi:MAG: hypothetical protein L6Q71_11895 [Planctomycetes bacterium]|nr:hypothetical protein [Planctomycetota bacterium]NUQ34608.1 hypothetical protein [Planctomycetaceae bacterium]
MDERKKMMMSVVASSLASLVSALFTPSFVIDSFEQMFVKQGMDLPVLTTFFLKYHTAAYAVPVLIAIVGFSGTRKGGNGLYVAHGANLFGWLFAISWPMACVTALWLPCQAMVENIQ